MSMRVITSKDVKPYTQVNCEASKNIVTSELQDSVKITDMKKGSFVMESKVVDTSVIDTQQYIDSFKDDVGIANILAKFNLVNDPSLFVQVKRPTVPIAEDGSEVVQDYSHLPANEEEAAKILRKARSEYDALPKELTKGRSFIQFAENCTKEEIVAFINSVNKSKDGGQE